MKNNKWIYAILFSLIIVSVLTWWLTLDKLPAQIRIAAGKQGGQYAAFAEYLKPILQQRLARPVIVLESEGSADNTKLLNSGKADLGILQLGPLGIDRNQLLAPLYPEIVQVLVKKDSNIKTWKDMQGKRISISKPGSGMRLSADQLFKHLDLNPKIIATSDAYFTELENNPALDAAIVTTGIMNPDLRRLLLSGRYGILSIPSAKGMAIAYPFVSYVELPVGVYRGGVKALPDKTISTIGTMAVLTTRPNTSKSLITNVLQSLYQSDAVYRFPGMLTKDKAAAWHVLPKHPVATAYFNPYDGIDTLASMMESLAAGKELMFAIGAGIYMIWDIRRRRKKARLEKDLSAQKDRLDEYLQQTITIEKLHVMETDQQLLREYLAQVTAIKLDALTEFTSEELRADRAFTIFLMQCANLSMKLHAQIRWKQET
jgi:TRAP transporter TAXI family solute receptor